MLPPFSFPSGIPSGGRLAGSRSAASTAPTRPLGASKRAGQQQPSRRSSRPALDERHWRSAVGAQPRLAAASGRTLSLFTRVYLDSMDCLSISRLSSAFITPRPCSR
jgi:hypothetical protein